MPTYQYDIGTGTKFFYFFNGATYLNDGVDPARSSPYVISNGEVIINPYYGTRGPDNVTNDSNSGVATLTEFGAPAGTVYSGVIVDSTQAGLAGKTRIVQTSGDLTLVGANTFSGGLVIEGGSITAGANQTLGAISNSVTVDGTSTGLSAVLDIGATTQQVATLTVTDGTVNVGQGGSLTASSATVGSLGFIKVASGGTVTDDLNNTGTVDNAGTFNATVAQNTGTITNRSTGTWNGSITTNAGLIGNSGHWNGDVDSNSSKIGNAPSGIWTGNVLANTGTIVNAGQWQGQITNSPGGAFFTAGVIKGGLDNGGTVTSYGGISQGGTSAGGIITGPVTNSGIFFVQGPQIVDAGFFDTSLAGQSAQTTGITRTSGDFNNTGTLALENGATLQIGGTLTNGSVISLASGSHFSTLSANNYIGQAGSQLVIGVDLSPVGTSATAGKASQLNFGTASGLTTLAFENVSNQGQIGYFPRIQVVNVTTGGTGVFVADQSSLSRISNGLFGYSYNDGALVGSMNSSVGAASAILTTTVLTTLNSNFFQDWQPFEREAFITAPQDPAPNTIEGGPWIRGKVGHESDDATSTAGDTVSRERVSTDFTGFQLGGDIGRFNINGSGWNVIGGITGGEFFANSAEKLAGTTKGNFEIPYVGGYAALTRGPFFVDVLYHHDFYGLKLNDASAGLSDQKLNGNGDSVHLESAYNVALGNYGAFGNVSVSPTGSLIFSRVELDNLSFSALNLGTVKFDPIDSVLGRAGVKVASSFATERLAWQPFVIASVWHEFEGRTTSEFDSTTGFAVPMSVSRVGTFGQVGLGLNGELIGKNLLGTLRADFRFGDRTSGESFTAQARYAF